MRGVDLSGERCTWRSGRRRGHSTGRNLGGALAGSDGLSADMERLPNRCAPLESVA